MNWSTCLEGGANYWFFYGKWREYGIWNQVDQFMNWSTCFEGLLSTDFSTGNGGSTAFESRWMSPRSNPPGFVGLLNIISGLNRKWPTNRNLRFIEPEVVFFSSIRASYRSRTRCHWLFEALKSPCVCGDCAFVSKLKASSPTRGWQSI